MNRAMQYYSTRCCINPSAIPANYACLMPDIIGQYYNLSQRLKRMTTKKKRILRLAEPKYEVVKYQPICECRETLTRKTELIHLDEPARTRTEQLAYPSALTLMDLKSHTAFQKFPRFRKNSVNRMLHKSLHSLYSNLSSTKPPQQPLPVAKWTPSEWEVHRRRLSILSKPKPELPEPELEHEKPSKPLRRYKRLCQPKLYDEAPPKEWQLTFDMKTYTPSERLLKMAKPRPDIRVSIIDNPFQVKSSALYYRATERIQDLSRPNLARLVYVNNEKTRNPFVIKSGALKAKASQRIVEIAQPREFSDKHNRPNPYKVSRKALKVVATPRLIQLAQPKIRLP